MHKSRLICFTLAVLLGAVAQAQQAAPAAGAHDHANHAAPAPQAPDSGASGADTTPPPGGTGAHQHGDGKDDGGHRHPDRDKMDHGKMGHGDMEHGKMDHGKMDHDSMHGKDMGPEVMRRHMKETGTPTAPPSGQGQHDHGAADPAAGGHTMAMTGMYGPYPMAREASGTAWQPDSAPMEGIHDMGGTWSTMLHGAVNIIYDHQGGPRGADKTFSSSMLMGMAQREVGTGGTLGLRGMLSLDPAMGRSGYPLLYQTGESADGRAPLIDRQHPHDLFMELAATYSQRLSDNTSTFVYVGLPGEPALGPPAFMHRFSGADNPEAPISHHWLDSTHITYGVATLGATWRNWKLEASAFNGREPDQYRWNIETRRFDSGSARLSWNPTANWSLQVSHGRLASPEQLEPNVSVRRTTASAIYDTQVGSGHWQTTLAWGRNRLSPGNATSAWLLESAYRWRDTHTVFTRFERVGKDELFTDPDPRHHTIYTVNKLSLGYVFDFAKWQRLRFGVGGVVSAYSAPSALDSVYGSHPKSGMVFLRARIE